MAAPITVERRCPTLMGLAMLGEEKSMTIFWPLPSAEVPKQGPCSAISDSTVSAKAARSMVKLR